jgi:hypothetical protein
MQMSIDRLRAQKQSIEQSVASKDEIAESKQKDGMLRAIMWASKSATYPQLKSICDLEPDSDLTLESYICDVFQLVSGNGRLYMYHEKGLWPLMARYLGEFETYDQLDGRIAESSLLHKAFGFINGCRLVVKAIDDPDGEEAKFVDAFAKAVDRESPTIEQVEENRIQSNLASSPELTPSPMTCFECGYQGTMGLLGKQGLIFKKMKMKCPCCNQELLEA